MTTAHPPCLFSAIVLSFNSSRYIEDCVAHLLEAFAAFERPSEILIVENGSRDGSDELVRGLAAAHPDVVKPIYSEVNLGTTVSRNKALTRATGDYLLVLDSDATIGADALGKLRAALDADPTIGIAVPQLHYPDGRFQISTDQFPTITHKLRRFFALKSMERDATAPAAMVDVDYAISACWLMTRAACDLVGPLDENIFYSPEDVDYCVRMWLAGQRIVYVPDAIAIHDAQELSRGDKLSRFTLSHAQGLLYFFNKHRYWFRRAPLARRFPAPAPPRA